MPLPALYMRAQSGNRIVPMTDHLQQAADLTQSAIAALDRAEADVPAAMLDHALHIINEMIAARSEARAAAN